MPREAAGHRTPLVVDIDVRRAEARRAGLEALGEHPLHLDDLGLVRLALEGLLAHHPHPDRAVPDQRRDVDAQPRLDRLQVVLERLPGPVDPLLERGHRQVFDLPEHAAQPVALRFLERRQRQRAVAGHDGRHAVLQRRSRLAIPAELRVVVRVRVDEPGRSCEPPGVDLSQAAFGHPPDAHDPPILDADLAAEPGRSSAVVDVSVANDEVHGPTRFCLVTQMIAASSRALS